MLLENIQYCNKIGISDTNFRRRWRKKIEEFQELENKLHREEEIAIFPPKPALRFNPTYIPDIEEDRTYRQTDSVDLDMPTWLSFTNGRKVGATIIFGIFLPCLHVDINPIFETF